MEIVGLGAPKLWQAFRIEAPRKQKTKLLISDKVKIKREKQGKALQLNVDTLAFGGNSIAYQQWWLSATTLVTKRKLSELDLHSR